MAIFGSKKNTETKAAKKVASKPKVAKAKVEKAEKSEKTEKKVSATVVVSGITARDLSRIIRRPRITEKASMNAASGVYAFEVSPEATKRTIAAAVAELYNVVPVKVAIVPIPHKQVMIRNRKGVSGGGKKAYVYLKKGETIEFV
jgi:large subunit ribosomal protein L23